MKLKQTKSKAPAERVVKDIRHEGIAQGVYYKWSKDFMEAGKRRFAGDTARAANTDEVRELRKEARDLNKVVAKQETVR